MMRFVEDRVCRVLDRDDAWFGVRRFKPAPDRPYPSSTLLVVCLVHGVIAAAMAYGVTWLALRAIAPLLPLRDDSTWLPRLAAWLVAIAFGATQVASMWCWNRRAARLDPAACRPRRTRRGDRSGPFSAPSGRRG